MLSTLPQDRISEIHSLLNKDSFGILKKQITTSFNPQNIDEFPSFIQTLMDAFTNPPDNPAYSHFFHELCEHFGIILSRAPIENILIMLGVITTQIQSSKMENGDFVLFLPICLNSLGRFNVLQLDSSEDSSIFTANQIQFGIVKNLCQIEWNNKCALQLISSFKECNVFEDCKFEIFEKFQFILSNIPIDLLPEAIYNVFLLCDASNSSAIFQVIYDRFSQLDCPLEGSNGSIDHFNYLGICLMHMNYFAKIGILSQSKMVKIIKTSAKITWNLILFSCIFPVKTQEPVCAISTLRDKIAWFVENYQKNLVNSFKISPDDKFQSKHDIEAAFNFIFEHLKFGWDIVLGPLFELCLSMRKIIEKLTKDSLIRLFSLYPFFRYELCNKAKELFGSEEYLEILGRQIDSDHTFFYNNFSIIAEIIQSFKGNLEYLCKIIKKYPQLSQLTISHCKSALENNKLSLTSKSLLIMVCLDPKSIPDWHILCSLSPSNHFSLIRSVAQTENSKYCDCFENYFFSFLVRKNSKHLIPIEDMDLLCTVPVYIYFFLTCTVTSQRFLNFFDLFKKYLLNNPLDFFGISTSNQAQKNSVILNSLLALYDTLLFKYKHLIDREKLVARRKEIYDLMKIFYVERTFSFHPFCYLDFFGADKLMLIKKQDLIGFPASQICNKQLIQIMRRFEEFSADGSDFKDQEVITYLFSLLNLSQTSLSDSDVQLLLCLITRHAKLLIYLPKLIDTFKLNSVPLELTIKTKSKSIVQSQLILDQNIFNFENVTVIVMSIIKLHGSISNALDMSNLPTVDWVSSESEKWLLESIIDFYNSTTQDLSWYLKESALNVPVTARIVDYFTESGQLLTHLCSSSLPVTHANRIFTVLLSYFRCFSLFIKWVTIFVVFNWNLV